ncbi:hypothetical protein [Longimicrobium terrae]|uniref:Uncharacterized protein n=1 Tax=Longimicrobium terrae TaxID=1639882 RepID=A0A841GVT6_9BACT|nr:hypothetical protein [Longimicrobium terrae]MBB4635159.1 hypothetical protein [Longimicrobium terrae]MBB6069553.1 hypothetical protein [Longimicrobium terrae]NNC31644.1 hypothetical protein [Longimicrobium terrae]
MKIRILLVAAALAACSHAGRHAGPLPSPGQPAAPAFQPNELQNDLFRLSGLRPLQAVRLPNGTREVRVWPVTMGYPLHLYRIVQTPAGVSGQLLWYWPTQFDLSGEDRDPEGETFHDLILYSHQGNCAGMRRVWRTAFCRARFVREPDWAAVLRRMDEHGLDTLPDPSTFAPDSIVVLDGWGFRVETRREDAYRTYAYDNPEDHPRWPTSPDAIRMYQALSAVDSLIRPSDSVRIYSGVTTGAWNSAFHPCGTGEAWNFGDDLRDRQRKEPRPAWTVGDDTTALYRVTVRGQASPRWLARRWESRFPRELDVHEILEVRPAPSGACER